MAAPEHGKGKGKGKVVMSSRLTSGECGGLGSDVHSVTELGMPSETLESDFGISPSANSGGG